ncbi:adenylate/guanylate cyclase domain-containing protein [Neorhodopirellula pilleata]|uniref:adenylate/guanylate cyclase domain-containing protein n=1 Tax=Neorhodopirellula pilleata TaxID=2714738 RepID=UPI001E35C6EB|nr:adenylate/guanylate cyclase domain-containing protein [Neorhodopirellula pilleata]
MKVTLKRGHKEFHIGESGLPLEIGRQSRGEDVSVLCTVQDHGNQFRIAIAEITVLSLPRHALRIEASQSGELVCVNLHSQSAFRVSHRSDPVMPGERVAFENQLIIALPEDFVVEINVVMTSRSGAGGDPSRTNEVAATTPFRTITRDELASSIDGGDFTMPLNPHASFARTFASDSNTERRQGAIDLVRQALAVVKKSAGSDEFFETAVHSVAKMIELDRAYVLIHEGGGAGVGGHWSVRASYLEKEQRRVPPANFGHRDGDSGDTAAASGPSSKHQVGMPDKDTAMPSGSRTLLQQVLKERQTIIYEPESYQHTVGSSIMLLDRAVAAPIFDDHGEVVGALYGDRTLGSAHADSPIDDLEAMLLEVMAGAVSAGMNRQRHEAIQNSMTQFFSPAITQRLLQNEDLLTGRDAEVSVLFCDIRGFSSISERVGPEKTIQWINDVFTKLSRCVVRTDGVLVNYIGDELVAMWGAPAEQPDHARRACEAACQMLQEIDPLRERWKAITPEKFGVGIGIHTGIARVGNTGSEVKFQYGPLGNTVNLASRVQNITKKFGITAIITEATRDALKAVVANESPASDCLEHLQTRRLATVRPLGITETVDLYQLQTGNDPTWQSMAQRYESALDLYHQSDLTGAARVLASLVHEHPDDTPSVVLLGRVVDAITSRSETINPVMEFKTK